MTKIIFMYGAVLIIAGMLLYPGYMLAVKLIKGIEKRKPTIAERVLACVPYFNLSLVDSTINGQHKRVLISGVALALAVAIRIFLYLSSGAILASLISLVALWIIFIWTFLLQSYILITVANMLDMSMFVKVLCVTFPPAAMYFIGKDCALKIHEIEEEIIRKEIEEV